jgi:iron complex outermembrane recepter protein
MPFFSRVYFDREEAEPLMLTADGGLPPRISRERYYGQPWSMNSAAMMTYGTVAEGRFGNWITRLGVFDSSYAPKREFGELFLDIQDDGNAHEVVFAFPDSRYASRSGELRVSRSFEEAARRHTLHFAFRGRNQQRRYGGEDEIDIGTVVLGEGRPIPRPDLSFGPQTHDEVKQQTFGAAYELQWKRRGEVSVGVQKSRYRKSIETPLGELPESRADPLLLNATATFFAHERLAIYASYTEGLEESPVAPDNAINRNAAAPALDTEQYDAGIRWTVVGNMKLIAGIFHIEKPYFDVDPSRVFRSLGTVEHQGVELSLAGNPTPQLTLVAGSRFLDAEVSGDAVDSGLIGRKPVGKAKRYSIASADYRIEGTGLSVDTIVENLSRQTANTANTVEVPGRTVMHLGGRYRFTAFGKPTTMRAQWSNIFARYGWTALNGGAYVYNAPRRFYAYVAMDL